MQWNQMQKPLRQGMQVFREEWPEDVYLMVEDDELQLFSGEHPEGVPCTSLDGLDAEDWMATGPSGM